MTFILFIISVPHQIKLHHHLWRLFNRHTTKGKAFFVIFSVWTVWRFKRVLLPDKHGRERIFFRFYLFTHVIVIKIVMIKCEIVSLIFSFGCLHQWGSIIFHWSLVLVGQIFFKIYISATVVSVGGWFFST